MIGAAESEQAASPVHNEPRGVTNLVKCIPVEGYNDLNSAIGDTIVCVQRNTCKKTCTSEPLRYSGCPGFDTRPRDKRS